MSSVDFLSPENEDFLLYAILHAHACTIWTYVKIGAENKNRIVFFFTYDSTCFPRNIVLKLSDEIQLLESIWSISKYITQWLLLCHVYAILQNQRVSTHMRVYDILSCLMEDFSTSFPEIGMISYYKEFFPVANAAVW